MFGPDREGTLRTVKRQQRQCPGRPRSARDRVGESPLPSSRLGRHDALGKSRRPSPRRARPAERSRAEEGRLRQAAPRCRLTNAISSVSAFPHSCNATPARRLSATSQPYPNARTRPINMGWGMNMIGCSMVCRTVAANSHHRPIKPKAWRPNVNQAPKRGRLRASAEEIRYVGKRRKM
jgi:hypothetical protein